MVEHESQDIASDHVFWEKVIVFMSDPETSKKLMLDTIMEDDPRRASGKACWAHRVSRTLTHRLHDLAREYGRPELVKWFVGVIPNEKWPLNRNAHIVVYDDKMKHWGLLELAGRLQPVGDARPLEKLDVAT